MRFYRLLLALFLVLFTSEFCVAQSWDWVAGVDNTVYTEAYVSVKGHAYIATQTNSTIQSTADSLINTNDLIVKLDKNGRKLCGSNFGIKAETEKTQIIAISGNNQYVFAILLISQTTIINNKTFNVINGQTSLILLKLDTQCNIVNVNIFAKAEGSFTSFDNLLIDDNSNIYFSFTFKGKINIDSKTFTGLSGDDGIFIKCKEDGSYLWDYKYVEEYPTGIINNKHFDKSYNLRFLVLSEGSQIQNILYFIDINGKPYFRKELPVSNIYGVTSDNEDNFIVVGQFSYTLYLTNTEKVVTHSHGSGIIIKFDKNLNLIWHREIISNSESLIRNVITDDSSNIYVAGDNFTVDNTYLADIKFPQSQTFLHFFEKISRNGDGLWLGYILNNSYVNWSNTQLMKDKCNNVYVVGKTILISTGLFNYSIGYKEKRKLTIYGNSIYGKHNYYIAKLNTDKLEFEISETCEGIYFKNTSETAAYTSFEWTLPDGTKHFSKDAYIETNKYKDTVLISLKGIKPNGCENTFTYKIKFKEMPKPVAKFAIDSFVGCQWVGIKFYNQSYKTIDPRCWHCESFEWDFGDGTTSFNYDSVVQHIYTKPGTYKISLYYRTGDCVDTFTLEKQITIIEAPKPGFTVNQKEGCAPLTVKITNQSVGQVETYFYTSGDGQNSNQAAPTFTFTKPGKYFITQYLKGPTECITKDSVQITVRAGYDQTTQPEILTATVTDSNFVKVSWKKNDVTAGYKLIRQDENSTQTFNFTAADSFYLDKNVDVNKAFYSYTLYGTDSCGNTKLASHKAQTILLENHSQTTDHNFIRWSPYEDWKNGVLEYKLQYKLDSQFATLQNFPGNINAFKDENLYPIGAKQICYKVIAAENGGNNQQSQSNTVCMHFLPTIFVPNAFSPNNDLTNDVFTISAIGIEKYELSIYNRWGERIYRGTEKDSGWDGKFKNSHLPEGIYLYKISAKPYQGKSIYQSGNLHLLR